MRLNPFIEVEYTDDKYLFFEKYRKIRRPFLVFKAEKDLCLEKLLSNNKLTEIFTHKLHYPFAIKEGEETIYKLIKENVEMSLAHVNKELLAKFLMVRLYSSTIKVINATNYDFSTLVSRMNLTYGDEFQIFLVIREKEKKYEEELLFDHKGLVLNFEMADGLLSGVGPFIEKDKGDKYFTNYDDEREGRVVERQKDYWDRPKEEVIMDTAISGIVDYFSDYISIASPFFNKEIQIKKDKIMMFKMV